MVCIVPGSRYFDQNRDSFEGGKAEGGGLFMLELEEVVSYQ